MPFVGRGILLAAALAAPATALAQGLAYPLARKAEVVEERFGVKVADPYRWMEDQGSKELDDWVSAQHALAAGYLRALPLRAHFHKRFTELWNHSRTTIPVVEGGRWFYRHNSGLQLQSAIYMREGMDAPRVLVLDPNVLSPDGSVALADFRPSPDGKLVVYALAEGGADWRTLRVRDIASGRDLSDEVKWVRFSSLSWTRDGKGFFYSRFPEPPPGRALHATLGTQALYYHRLGTPQSQDVLVYERPDLPRGLVSAWLPREGRYLLVRVNEGASPTNRLYYVDLGDPQQPDVRAAVKPLAETDGAEYTALGHVGPLIYVKTDDGAPNRKIVAIDARDPRREAWRTVVPEGKEPIRFVGFYADHLLVEYLSDVQSRLALFDRRTGQPQGEISLPDTGSVSGIGGQRSGYIFYEFSSPLHRPTLFAYDPKTRQSLPFEPPGAPLDASRYETRRLFATSKDGTRVPFFVTARKDLKLDGANPALLLGYGGFSISLPPVYRSQVIAWLELGGVWASANIRGGGEYGREWHLAARAEKRQNGFDDFIAVTEHLIKEKYTSPAKLGIWGRSNGGLLVSVVSQQRPELYAAVLSGVPVTDMLRFDRFTGGRAWIPEYGSPQNPEQFRNLLRYSPLHNVKAGTCYPAILLTTADHDDRVVPNHAFKFAAAVQAAQPCPRPVLLRYEAKASHGYTPTERLIAEYADVWAFAAEHTGMRAPRH